MHNKTYLFLISLFLLDAPVFAEDHTQTESLVFTCYTCHGPEGKSPGEIPALQGLTTEEIKSRMMEFRNDQSDPTIMNRIAKGYSENEIDRIAEYLSSLNSL